MTRLFRLWASEGDRNSAYFACAAFDRDWHIATETMLMTGGRFRGKAEVRQDELRNMKVSKIEVFQRNARFARTVAECVRSPAGRAHWLSIAEFWTLHSDAYGHSSEDKKPLGPPSPIRPQDRTLGPRPPNKVNE